MSTTLTVDGMSCGSCESTVVEALEGVEGVDAASADHERGRATVEGDADELDLVVAVQDAGYGASA
ncbi:heavy-metal-associated domain-containing protein [Halobium palmae]|uniref:Heavy-metal-associated domain-containing protein n=1 Tax=Halobium palmae TaxID=1776492 RepID=A0ABD5S1L3_9EURY